MSDHKEWRVSSEKLPQMDVAYDLGKGYDSLSELMRAIILRTIDDYHTKGEFRAEAVDYMMGGEDGDDDNEDYIFSFASICRHLGLDPAKTRHMIMHAQHRISTRRRAA